MRTHLNLKNQMMGIIKAAIEDVTADQLIVFKEGDTVLCEVPFLSLSAMATDAKYEFVSLENTRVLKSIVTVSGTVDNFTIEGKVNGGLDTANSGTVGKLTSQTADIKFNKTLWPLGVTITISNLQMYINEGL